MPNVTVSKDINGKYRVLVNYIQNGAPYGSQEVAEHEAAKLREGIAERYATR